MAVVGVLLAGSILGACGGAKRTAGPAATVPQGTTTTDPYAVPAVIDEPYVNRVLAGAGSRTLATSRRTVLRRPNRLAHDGRSVACGRSTPAILLELRVASFEADLRRTTFRTKTESLGDRKTGGRAG